MKIRLRFSKYNTMKYIGHLDMLRYFQKAFRRAKVPMKYSEGFNPHPVMSFAAPLGVGVTSEGEYMDIEVTQDVDLEKLVFDLNQQMVEGVDVLSAMVLDDHTKKAMAAVTCAKYVIYLKKNSNLLKNVDIAASVKSFYEDQSEILVVKKTKKGEKEVDLKPFIFDFRGSTFEDRTFYQDLKVDIKNDEFCCEATDPVFVLQVSTGSNDNIKPELVFSALYRYLGIEEEPVIAIHRVELYQKEAPDFISLGA
ncbi:MAG: TIGR03936 family radical SAM-associated protein [Lachnospiraceae bacterium]|nr:TIGR03936 family radical SAM-associated protein [Lachnospiraceae bacterium]